MGAHLSAPAILDGKVIDSGVRSRRHPGHARARRLERAQRACTSTLSNEHAAHLHKHGMVNAFRRAVPDDATMVSSEASGIDAHAHWAMGT